MIMVINSEDSLERSSCEDLGKSAAHLFLDWTATMFGF